MKPGKKYVGRFFHTLTEDGGLKWQGRVDKRRKDGRYTCQLFEWILGYPSNQVTMTEDQLSAARLYSTADQWRKAADRLQQES